MAFVSENQDEEKNKNQGQPGAIAPVTTSSAPGAGPGMAPATSATGATASNQAAPQPFTNLQAYLTANQPQIQQMGQNVANQLTNTYGEVSNDINAGKQSFQDQVKAGYTSPNADLVNQAISNPAEFSKDQNNVTNFQKQLNNAYTGPTNFENSDIYGNLNKEVQGAVEKANLLNSPSGIQTYLMGLGNNPTKGDATLDQVLLSGNPDVYQTIKSAASPVTALADYLSSSIPSQNQAVQEAQAAASAGAQDAASKIGKVSSDFSNTLNSQYQAKTKESTDYNNMLNSIAQKVSNGNYGGLTPEERSLIGYNPDMTRLIRDYSSIFPTQAAQTPINFSSYFHQGPQAAVPQASDVVTPDQIAEFNALSLLSGHAPDTSFAMPQTSTSGTYQLPTELPGYSNAGAASAIKAAYGNMYQDLLNGSGIGGNAGGALGQLPLPITPEIQSYMEALSRILNEPQPAPQPINPVGPPPNEQQPLAGPNPGTWLGFV